MKIFFFLMLTVVADYRQQANYKAIPERYYRSDKKSMYEEITPKENYDYWEYCFTNLRNKTVIYRKGNQEQFVHLLPKSIPDRGFFEGPGGFNYIITVKNNQVEVITRIKELEKFIGKIDNLGEALFISNLNGYGFSSKFKETGLYKETSEGFELYLLHFDPCPETYRSVKAKLLFDGKFEVLSMNVIKKTGDCILEH